MAVLVATTCAPGGVGGTVGVATRDEEAPDVGPCEVGDAGVTDLGVPCVWGSRAIAVRVAGTTGAKVGSGVGTTGVGDGPGGASTTAMTGPTGALSWVRSKAVTV